jgi:hypothetical protein
MGKAHIEAMRAMMYKAFFAFDVRHCDPEPEQRKKANALVEISTPLCKAYPSDEAWWLIGEAIQAYGGYGYCEEYPVAQIARDVKIYSIWEGTNLFRPWIWSDANGPWAKGQLSLHSCRKCGIFVRPANPVQKLQQSAKPARWISA